MRILLATILATSLIALPSLAEDTKPPSIGDVAATSKGGSVVITARITDETGVLSATCFHRKAGAPKFDESPMTKSEFDDTFKVSFSGGGEIEYYIQATDLLGNGPSSSGSAAKPAVYASGAGKKGRGGGDAQAQAAPPPPPPPAEEPPPPPKKKRGGKRKAQAEASSETPPAEESPPPPTPSANPGPPVIVHRKPSVQPPEGQEFKLRFKVTSEAGVKDSRAHFRIAGQEKTKISVPFTNNGGDSYEVTIPANLAHGDLEYFLVVVDNAGQKTNQGDGDATTWFRISFKPIGSGGSSSAGASSGSQGSGPFIVHAGSQGMAAPRRPIVIRAQVSPTNIAQVTEQNADAAEAAVSNLNIKLLWREKDGEDQETAMTPDESGGLGGYQAQLSPLFDGSVIYYQVVVCSPEGKCAIDTGSKRRWNGLNVTSTPAEPPPPLDAVSSKAPAGLPE